QAGNTAEALIRAGANLGISSRSMGTTKQRADGVSIVEQFKLITWDLVSSPSTIGAYVNVLESMKDDKEAQDVLENIIKDPGYWLKVNYGITGHRGFSPNIGPKDSRTMPQRVDDENVNRIERLKAAMRKLVVDQPGLTLTPNTAEFWMDRLAQ